MACESMYRRRGVSMQDAVKKIKERTTQLSAAIAAGKVRVKVGPQGAVAFEGWTETDRDGITDACAYRRIMAEGSPLAKAAIMRAEQLAGRSVDQKMIAQGVHSHDGGTTWHGGH